MNIGDEIAKVYERINFFIFVDPSKRINEANEINKLLSKYNLIVDCDETHPFYTSLDKKFHKLIMNEHDCLIYHQMKNTGLMDRFNIHKSFMSSMYINIPKLKEYEGNIEFQVALIKAIESTDINLSRSLNTIILFIVDYTFSTTKLCYDDYSLNKIILNTLNDILLYVEKNSIDDGEGINIIDYLFNLYESIDMAPLYLRRSAINIAYYCGQACLDYALDKFKGKFGSGEILICDWDGTNGFKHSEMLKIMQMNTVTNSNIGFLCCKDFLQSNNYELREVNKTAYNDFMYGKDSIEVRRKVNTSQQLNTYADNINNVIKINNIKYYGKNLSLKLDKLNLFVMKDMIKNYVQIQSNEGELIYLTEYKSKACLISVVKGQDEKIVLVPLHDFSNDESINSIDNLCYDYSNNISQLTNMKFLVLVKKSYGVVLTDGGTFQNSTYEIVRENLSISEDGEVKLNIKPKKKLMDMYSERHTILMTNIKNNNIDALKHDIAYMYWLKTSIERDNVSLTAKTEEKRKDAEKARMFAINDYKTYSQLIYRSEPEFDFDKFYRKSGYDTLTIKFDTGTIKGIKKIMKSVF